VAADDEQVGLVLRVRYPHPEDWQDGDRDFLRQLTERHGGRFPASEMNSFPGQVDLWFPGTAVRRRSAPTSVRKPGSLSANGSPLGVATLGLENRRFDFSRRDAALTLSGPEPETRSLRRIWRSRGVPTGG
jgi:hypothetical protein